MRIILLLAAIGLCSCNSTKIFDSRVYHGAGNTLEFLPNNTYDFLVKMEGGYVYKYGHGSWRQDGRNLFLSDSDFGLSELPITLNSSLSSNDKSYLVINILPQKNVHFDYLPQINDLLNIELVLDGTKYLLVNPTNLIELQKPIDIGIIKAYPKVDFENQSEILIDTLHSQHFNLKGNESRIVTINVDSNPHYFARVRMDSDTLKVLSNKKLEWGEIKLSN